ncbi:MAG: hypothetical protein OEL79_05540 [Chromatiales bacterium]|nr:hypothetical protein [Chromatiales bacterium]
MNTQINISGKPVTIELSKAASAAMQNRTSPLLAEMELYFSCLIRKKVRFYDNVDSDDAERVHVNDGLAVRFRPVATQSCSVGDVEGDEPPVTDFPIAKPAAFVPHWLRIDYIKGEWCGEFGYQ